MGSRDLDLQRMQSLRYTLTDPTRDIGAALFRALALLASATTAVEMMKAVTLISPIANHCFWPT